MASISESGRKKEDDNHILSSSSMDDDVEAQQQQAQGRGSNSNDDDFDDTNTTSTIIPPKSININHASSEAMMDETSVITTDINSVANHHHHQINAAVSEPYHHQQQTNTTTANNKMVYLSPAVAYGIPDEMIRREGLNNDIGGGSGGFMRSNSGGILNESRIQSQQGVNGGEEVAISREAAAPSPPPSSSSSTSSQWKASFRRRKLVAPIPPGDHHQQQEQSSSSSSTKSPARKQFLSPKESSSKASEEKEVQQQQQQQQQKQQQQQQHYQEEPVPLPPRSIRFHQSSKTDVISVITDMNTVQYHEENRWNNEDNILQQQKSSPVIAAYGIPNKINMDQRNWHQQQPEVDKKKHLLPLEIVNSKDGDNKQEQEMDSQDERRNSSVSQWFATTRRSSSTEFAAPEESLVPVPPGEDQSTTSLQQQQQQQQQKQATNARGGCATKAPGYGLPFAATATKSRSKGGSWGPGVGIPMPQPIGLGENIQAMQASSSSSSSRLGAINDHHDEKHRPESLPTITEPGAVYVGATSLPQNNDSSSNNNITTPHETSDEEGGAIVRGGGDDEEEEEETTVAAVGGRQIMTTPGNSSRAFNSTTSNSVDGGTGVSTATEPLFTATLVSEGEADEDEGLPDDIISTIDVIEAVPAKEGFSAIVMNRRFKYIVGGFVCVLLAVLIPVSLLVKKSNNDSDAAVASTVMVMSIEECGSSQVKQTEYRGNISITASGRTCQRWDSQLPHVHHKYGPEDIDKFGLHENFCRNPDEKSRTGAWCYTTDPLVVAEHCAVPFCDTQDGLREVSPNEVCGTIAEQQADYRGTISVTGSGKECQRWDSQEPHEHSRTPNSYPFAGLAENYCRNPDGEATAWCYTNSSETRWEHCDVLACEAQVSPLDRPKMVPRQQCGDVSKKQSDYRGDISRTVNGTRCAYWGSSSTANDNGHTNILYPLSGLVRNFCRNPDGLKDRGWCYLEDGSWDYCSVPWCDEECGPFNQKEEDYRGIQATTSSGRSCLQWSEHTDLLESFPANTTEGESWLTEWGLTSNFCRNPEGEKESTWCFVLSNETTGEVDLEYCSICNDVDESSVEGNFTCGSLSENQDNYRGTISTTISNLTCQAWASQEPHAHKLTPTDRPLAGLDGNFCRNPDNSERAWCYTTNPDVLYDYCDVCE